MNSQNRLVVITGISIIAAVIALIIFSKVTNGSPASNQVSEGEVSFADIDTSLQPRLGEEDAPVEVFVFEDFSCPHCKDFTEQVLPQLEREFFSTGQAKLYFVNFAFMNANSTIAARASECAYQQDADLFWDYKTVLMRSQGQDQDVYTAEGLAQLASEYVPNLDAAALQQCVENEETAAVVQADADIARSHQISSTPTVVVQGQKTVSASLSAVREAISIAFETVTSPATGSRDNQNQEESTGSNPY